VGPWELPALGAVAAPAAVLIRPDGHVAWVGELAHPRLPDALTTWFGPPTATRDSVGRSSNPRTATTRQGGPSAAAG
jgi:hypothetical protein